MDTSHNRFDDHYPEIEILPEQLPDLIFGLLNSGNPDWDEDEDDYGHDDDIPEEDDIDDEDITSWDDGDNDSDDDESDDDDFHDDSEEFD
jgi:hypothetical protein